VWGWGANSFSGSIGDGTLIDRSSPVKTVGVSAVRDLATGGQHSVVVTTAATIAGLTALVQGLDLPQGIANGLLAKLNAAKNAPNAAAACSQLDGFIAQVQAQSGKALATEEADQLIGEAKRVKAGLGCP
jgi:hypothetical protein